MSDIDRPTPTPPPNPLAETAATREIVRRLAAAPRSGDQLPLEQLDRGLHCYEVEYRGFLSRQRRRPPIELEIVLRRAFRALADSATGAPALRLQALEARFHAAERLFAQRLELRDRLVLRPQRAWG